MSEVIYARIEGTPDLYELADEPRMELQWVPGWRYQLGQPDNRAVAVNVNPRYIRWWWMQETGEVLYA